MSDVLDGLSAVAQPSVLTGVAVGILVGMLVGAVPGVTATMAVALASGFTLTLEPIEGLSVLLAIYVAANFGDRVPAILINTPGTPASVATTFDGYPMARAGRAGVALTASAVVSAIGTLASLVVFLLAARPLAQLALAFGPAELFALVVFGLTMMIGVSGTRLAHGLAAGAFGLLLGTVGRDPITGAERFTFGTLELSSGIPFIAVIVGLFGVAEVFEQMLTRTPGRTASAITQLGRWWPTREEWRGLRRPVAVGSGVGVVVGALPAAGGDIAGIVSWDQARRVSRRPDQFGKGSLEGLAAADTASNATLGGSLTTTLSLGIPGDSVMAVVLGSMIIWGLQPGPALFVNDPSLLFTIAAIMLLATVAALAVSLLRVRGLVKLLTMDPVYLWVVILLFCIAGTYAVQTSAFDVAVMIAFGAVGLGMRRFGFPAGPVVLGLILGPLAESNLRRALVIDGFGSILSSPIAVALLALALAAVVVPAVRKRTRDRRAGSGNAHEPLSKDG